MVMMYEGYREYHWRGRQSTQVQSDEMRIGRDVVDRHWTACTAMVRLATLETQLLQARIAACSP
jgi:hypothetical protein